MSVRPTAPMQTTRPPLARTPLHEAVGSRVLRRPGQCRHPIQPSPWSRYSKPSPITVASALTFGSRSTTVLAFKMSLRHPDQFVHRHIGPDDNSIAEMLRTLGLNTLD